MRVHVWTVGREKILSGLCREVAVSGSSTIGNRRRFIRPYMEQHHFHRGIFASLPFRSEKNIILLSTLKSASLRRADSHESITFFVTGPLQREDNQLPFLLELSSKVTVSDTVALTR